MIGRRAFVLVALAGCVPGERRSDRPGPQRERELDATPAPPPTEPEAAAVAELDPYEAHIAALKDRLDRRKFTILHEHPFVVIGDEAPDRVRRYASGTVRWAVERLKAAYFERDPDEIIDIWLFGSERSYRKNALALFGERPDTPYGYYTPEHRALVMNIATGGGTLVHEIVHPFMASNFPACPDWFNEGLASLYEQSSERDGAIVGLTNWRLAGLQDAIHDGSVPSFQRLTSARHSFYRDDPGTNYAQARYLCYYLQEAGALRDFYRAFVENHVDDPTGYRTLQDTVARLERHRDMKRFQNDWQRYVVKLRFG